MDAATINILIWLTVFFILASVYFIIRLRKYRYVVVAFIVVFTIFMASRDRLELYTPINGLPDPNAEFMYYGHRSKLVDNKPFVVLWLSTVDKDADLLYIFEQSKNEELKRQLDRLEKRVQEGTATRGPYKFRGDDVAGFEGTDGDSNQFTPHGSVPNAENNFDSIVESRDSYPDGEKNVP